MLSEKCERLRSVYLVVPRVIIFDFLNFKSAYKGLRGSLP